MSEDVGPGPFATCEILGCDWYTEPHEDTLTLEVRHNGVVKYFSTNFTPRQGQQALAARIANWLSSCHIEEAR